MLMLKSIVNLPNPSLITEPEKIAYMISISSRGFCGEDDFRSGETKEPQHLAGTKGNF
jgi:hypothetical protein